ncbi:MAG: ATP-binding protein [Actinomycetaceae bacterium]|nr:ATP-binding protein [Actinomycetaceae bacterium]
MPSSQHLRARVIILAGPSGSGKTSLSTRTGIPALSLDHFYRDHTEADMPRFANGIIDWDTPESWNRGDALEALLTLCRTGQARIPVYDIPTSLRTGTMTWTLAPEQRIFIAEGIFATTLISDLKSAGVLADALCIARSPLRNMWFRLLRDLGEGRKSTPILLWRGAHLAIGEPRQVKKWIADGARPIPSLEQAEQRLRLLAREEGATPPS